MLWIKIGLGRGIENNKGGDIRVVRDGLSEKTTFGQIIVLGTSSIKITKLNIVISIEIKNCVKKYKQKKLLLEMRLIKAFITTSKELEQWFSVGCTFESSAHF